MRCRPMGFGTMPRVYSIVLNPGVERTRFRCASRTMSYAGLISSRVTSHRDAHSALGSVSTSFTMEVETKGKRYTRSGMEKQVD